MRLVGVAALDADARREGRGRVVGLGRGKVGKAGEQLIDRAVAGHGGRSTDHERAATSARPSALAEGDDVLAPELA